MATAAPNQGLPLFYNSIEPLNLEQHGKMKVRGITSMPEMGRTHAVPLTVDEFTLVQRHYPIVFSVGGAPVPIALMGLNEGINVFLDQDGRALDPNLYIPAYLRRYPFLLARLRPDTDELSLCYDPTSGAIGDFDEGEPLFDGEQPSAAPSAISPGAIPVRRAPSRAPRRRRSWNSASSSRRPASGPTRSSKIWSN